MKVGWLGKKRAVLPCALPANSNFWFVSSGFCLETKHLRRVDVVQQ